jgi:hypothetical protein
VIAYIRSNVKLVSGISKIKPLLVKGRGLAEIMILFEDKIIHLSFIQ